MTLPRSLKERIMLIIILKVDAGLLSIWFNVIKYI